MAPSFALPTVWSIPGMRWVPWGLMAPSPAPPTVWSIPGMRWVPWGLWLPLLLHPQSDQSRGWGEYRGGFGSLSCSTHSLINPGDEVSTVGAYGSLSCSTHSLINPGDEVSTVGALAPSPAPPTVWSIPGMRWVPWGLWLPLLLRPQSDQSRGWGEYRGGFGSLSCSAHSLINPGDEVSTVGALAPSPAPPTVWSIPGMRWVPWGLWLPLLLRPQSDQSRGWGEYRGGLWLPLLLRPQSDQSRGWGEYTPAPSSAAQSVGDGRLATLGLHGVMIMLFFKILSNNNDLQ